MVYWRARNSLKKIIALVIPTYSSHEVVVSNRFAPLRALCGRLGLATKDKSVKVIVDPFGSRRHFKDGHLHRDDGPAVEALNGTLVWCVNGQRHRVDGPAIEYCDGSMHWYRAGRFHREDGPAIEGADGSKEWWVNGEFQRKEF